MNTIKMSHFTKAAEMVAGGHAHFDTQVAVCRDQLAHARVVSFVLSEEPIGREHEDITKIKLSLHAEMTSLAPEATEFIFEDEGIVLSAELED